LKSVQIILQARVPFPLGKGKVNKWFNLEIEEVETVIDELHPWRINIYLN